MRGNIRNAGGTAIFAVLFYCAFCLIPAHANAGPQEIVIVNNAALKTAQSLTLKTYKAAPGGKDRLIRNVVVGPVENDCTNGCGAESTAVGDGIGTYKIEVTGDTALESSAVTFSLRPGEEYVWMISNRATPPSIRKSAPGIETVADASPFRIDLVTYTKSDVAAATAQATAAQKRKSKSFWPFKPSQKSHISN
jgi:hypothetical protein